MLGEVGDYLRLVVLRVVPGVLHEVKGQMVQLTG